MKLLSLVGLSGLVAVVGGCAVSHGVCVGGDGTCSGPDASVPDVVIADVVTPDACLFCDATYDAPQDPTPGFFVLATETPAAPATDGSNWGGVEGFHIKQDGTAATPGGGLPKGPLVTDPLGLAFRWTTAELYLANRGGNLSGQSTITRFPYDKSTQTFGTGVVAITGFTGFHQLAFNHTEDEIFVATLNEGMRHFKLVGSTWTEQLPQLIGPPNWVRGVAVAPDGKRLYASSAGNIIMQWDLTTNKQLTTITLPDNTAELHFMSVCGPAVTGFTAGCSPARLYVSDATASGSRAVYAWDIDSTDNLVNETMIPASPTFTAVLSPDTLELFSGGSAANSIQRFSSASSWTLESTSIATQNNIGTILIFPENAVPVIPN